MLRLVVHEPLNHNIPPLLLVPACLPLCLWGHQCMRQSDELDPVVMYRCLHQNQLHSTVCAADWPPRSPGHTQAFPGPSPGLSPGHPQALSQSGHLLVALPPGLTQAFPGPYPGLSQAFPGPSPGLSQAFPGPSPGLSQAFPGPLPPNPSGRPGDEGTVDCYRG